MPATTAPMTSTQRSDADWQLSAEGITLGIRWFGLIIGYMLVNLTTHDGSVSALNGILGLGAFYALFDLLWHWRGAVFLDRAPLFVSAMEALFIGLLCYFESGIESPFRYYYFLSLLVCAIRYSPATTYLTLMFHGLSFTFLVVITHEGSSEEIVSALMMVIFMGWVTWASTALTTLLRKTGQELSELNQQLELRIAERTRELQQSQAMLVQQEKQAAFGLLAAGIAHEVGNPLTAISYLVQLMNRAEHDEETTERLSLIDEQISRIQRTLQEVIEFSRPGVKELSSVNLQEVIENALRIAKYYKRKKGKKIETEFAENLPTIRAVRDHVLQVFLNLILNALDATEEGTTIRIWTEVNGKQVRMLIADEGHGIQPDHQLKLFEPYFTTKTTGTGLGLFVCRNMVESMNGTIDLIESSETGTTFAVSFR